MKKKDFSTWVEIIVILLLFILSIYYVNKNLEFLQNSIGKNRFGPLLYILLLLVETVFAPVSVLPFIPIAAGIWGSLPAALLTLFGWTLGALLAFLLARFFGLTLVSRVLSLKDIQKFEKLIPERNIFLGIIVLRITLPTDIISYLLGLFSNVSWWKYTLATLIGFAPLAFLFAYSINISTNIFILLSILGIAALFLIIYSSIANKKKIKSGIRKGWVNKFK